MENGVTAKKDIPWTATHDQRATMFALMQIMFHALRNMFCRPVVLFELALGANCNRSWCVALLHLEAPVEEGVLLLIQRGVGT